MELSLNLAQGKFVGWGKMKIPHSVTVNTGEDSEVRKTIDRFFKETRSEIEKRVNTKENPLRFRRDILNLCELAPTPKQSDDYVHVLSYKEKVIAAVFETRTEMNYIHFDYFF